MKWPVMLAALALGVGVCSSIGALGSTETFTDTRELQTRQFYNAYEK